MRHTPLRHRLPMSPYSCTIERARGPGWASSAYRLARGHLAQPSSRHDVTRSSRPVFASPKRSRHVSVTRAVPGVGGPPVPRWVWTAFLRATRTGSPMGMTRSRASQINLGLPGMTFRLLTGLALRPTSRLPSDLGELGCGDGWRVRPVPGCCWGAAGRGRPQAARRPAL